jgi:hypothetical protein
VWQLTAHLQTGLLPDETPSIAGMPRPAAATTQLTAGPGAPFAAADRAFAHMARDSGAAAAFGNFAAPTGLTFSGTGEIVTGASFIRARMEESRRRSTWVWAPLFAGGSTDDGLGYTIGEATIVSTSDRDTKTFYTKYLTVWRRMPNGEVRFVVDGGNERPARVN